jgi:hypothetical protein
MARIGLDGRVSPLQRSLGSQWQDLELEARGLAATRLPSRAPVLFASDGDDLVWHAWKPTPGSPWTPWESLAGFAADIRATVIPNGGPWRDWTPIDDLPGGSRAIEVASLTGGGLVLLARGRDGGLYHRWQDKPFGRWHLWEVLETGIEQFSLTKPASGGLAVFAVARGGCLRHRKQTKPFGVFRIGMDHELSHRWRDSLDGPWTDLDRLGATRARRIALRPGSPGQGKIVIRIT